MLTACFSFLNDTLTSKPPALPFFAELIVCQQNNTLLLATSLLPKVPAQFAFPTCALVTELYTFLFLLSCSKGECQSTLLNSTDILSASFVLLPALATSPELPTAAKCSAFEAVGRLLHLLAGSEDEFVFRLNKVIRGMGENGEYRFHYALMAPVPEIRKYSEGKLGSRGGEWAYLKMVGWVLNLWKQETKILEDEGFV
jgi:hypothetical protein